MKKFSMRLLPLVLLFFFVMGLNSAPVPVGTAKKAAEGWLSLGTHRLGEDMDKPLESVEPVKDSTGKTLFYVANLSPEGYIIFSSDDFLEPVIAFTPSGKYDKNPRRT